MHRRWALVAVWALFAAASVGVGFGAAGLVGDPFSDPGGGSALSPVSLADSTPPAATATATPSHSPSPSSSSPGHSSPSPSHSTRPRTSTADPETIPEPAVRSVTTRGGYVGGSCRGGLVTVSASPAVGWRIDEIDRGPTDEAKVKFTQSRGDGEVEVHARCSGGDVRFEVSDDHGVSGSSGPGGGDG
jgi:hypothetical protein